MSLAEALEAAAAALPGDEDQIRPANGDPIRLLEVLSAEAAVRVLAWLLAHRPEEGAELADAWADEEGGAAHVKAVPETTLPKAGRKALRRVHHRLRSRGVDLTGARPAPEARVARLPAIDETLSEAFVSPIDPTGGRVVYFLEGNPRGGARILEVVVDDTRGVRAFDVYEAPRKKARAFVEALQRREHYAVAEVEPSAARALVARAHARQASDRPVPRAFFEWRRHVAESPAEAKLPGDQVREALGETLDRTRVESAASLVREGRIGPWPPGGNVLPDLLERIRAALDSPLIVSAAAKREQIDGLLEDAQEEIFGGEGAAVVAHRLRESAFVFWKRRDEHAARACLAAAAAFDAGEPRQNPVARAMLEVPLGPSLRSLEREEQHDEGDAEPSLLVKP